MVSGKIQSIRLQASSCLNQIPVRDFASFELITRGDGNSKGQAVSIFYGEHWFVHPYYLPSVKKLLKEAFGCAKPKIEGDTLVSTWVFKREADARTFDEQFSFVNGQKLLKVAEEGKLKRLLLPHGVRDFLRALADPRKEKYFKCYEAFMPHQKRLKGDDFFAKKLLEALETLENAEQSGREQDLLSSSACIQKLVIERELGLKAEQKKEKPSREETEEQAEEQSEEENEEEDRSVASEGGEEDAQHSAEEGGETVLEEAIQSSEGEEEDAAALSRPVSYHEKRQRQKIKNHSVLSKAKELCSQRCLLKNSYGNIIVNQGEVCLIGADAPPVSVAAEVVKSLTVQDNDISASSTGDLYNAELLQMIAAGPSRRGGASSLHVWFNDQLSIPVKDVNASRRMSSSRSLQMTRRTAQEELGRARTWLKASLLAAATSFFEEASVGKISTAAWEQERHVFVELLGHCLERRVTLESCLDELPVASEIRLWIEGARTLLPPLCWVTSVRRQARSHDPVATIRHPITQPIPHLPLMVDPTRTGAAIRIAAQFCDLSGADFDGDTKDLAVQKSTRKRKLCNDHFSIARLSYNALGKKVVKLTGIAPLALRLFQQNGEGCPQVYALAWQPREDRVLWKGLLETTFSRALLCDCFRGMGTAIPSLLQPLAASVFEERSFSVKLLDSGEVFSSLHEGVLGAVSHDGYLPVPCTDQAAHQASWIKEQLMQNLDMFPYLKGKSFSVMPHCNPRPSALNGLTFSGLLSLVHAFTPSNFQRSDGKLQVLHVPGLVHEGLFQTYRRGFSTAWHRMSAMLLKLWSSPRTVRGEQALKIEVQRFSWRPSSEELKCCLLSNALVAEKLQFLQHATSEDALKALAAGHVADLESTGFHVEAQMLWNYAFPNSFGDSSRSTSRELWEQRRLGHLWKLELEPCDASSDEGSSEEASLRLRFVRGVMTQEAWIELERAAPALVTRRYFQKPSLPRCQGGPAVKNWRRLFLMLQSPVRNTADVEETLEQLMGTYADEKDYCMVLINLETLGYKLGALLNQPAQTHMILEEDVYARTVNLALEEARRDFPKIRMKAVSLYTYMCKTAIHKKQK